MKVHKKTDKQKIKDLQKKVKGRNIFIGELKKIISKYQSKLKQLTWK
jgi:hypothetical protein